MSSSDGRIGKPQRGRPKRAELPDVNINTGAQSINTERAKFGHLHRCPQKSVCETKFMLISSRHFLIRPLLCAL